MSSTNSLKASFNKKRGGRKRREERKAIKRDHPSNVNEKETKENKVVIAKEKHLLPFRTEKLSPSAPMVLPEWVEE